jgi:hypothetical protein
MSDFAELVRGRTVAVVGRAPILPGQGDQIDAHDVVYRTAKTPVGEQWGERTDAVFLNWQVARDIYQRRSLPVLDGIRDVPWWVYKAKPREVRRDGRWRVARWPNINNPNAVTLMLWDLIRHHEPASVTVYAADLYASGPGHAYTPDVDGRPLDGQAAGIIKHRPLEQRKVHKAVVKTGRIIGDPRYLQAVAMPDEQYQAVIDDWNRVYRSPPTTV